MHKLVVLGAIAGCAASIPIVYQSNPDALHSLVKSAVDQRAPEPEKRPLVVIARQPEASTEVLLGKKVRLTPDAGGHYRADFRINGRDVNAMIDTGATLVALNQTTARHIGIKLAASDFQYKVETANGSTDAAAARIERIQIGRINVENVQALVLRDDALSETLVGLSFLNKLHSFGVEGGSLVLEQ